VEIRDPGDLATFESCKLERTATLPLYRDLLQLRRTDPAFQKQSLRGVDGSVLAPQCFLLRFLTGGAGDRLLIVNLGVDLNLLSPPEPLLAPPGGHRWEIIWSSEHPRYGGIGTPPVENADGWRIPGTSRGAGRGQKALPSNDSGNPCGLRVCRRSSHQWLVSNGLGGYAFGTVSGLITQSYHGYRIAAMPVPLGRMMLNDVIERVHLRTSAWCSWAEGARGLPPSNARHHCRSGFVWRTACLSGILRSGMLLEKRVIMPYRRTPSS
jgi:hypothetical protein